jgi:hypothetical protein
VRVILDECLPRRLGLELNGHAVSTVSLEGWAGISNGKLLQRIQGHFDAFITIDKNLPAQQKATDPSFGVVVLRARSNKLEDLKPLVPLILAALDSLRPGQVALVSLA